MPESSKSKAPKKEGQSTDQKDVIEPKAADSAALADPTAPSLKKKLKNKLQNASASSSTSDSKGAPQMSSQAIEQLLQMNPQLREQIGGLDQAAAAEALKKMDIGEMLTGMSLTGKNQKDMDSYKFWNSQPVRRFDDKPDAESGPIKIINQEEVRKEPYPLVAGFEWSTLDLDNDSEVKELYELLTMHYVEDDNAMFRFNYSQSFLNWYL